MSYVFSQTDGVSDYEGLAPPPPQSSDPSLHLPLPPPPLSSLPNSSVPLAASSPSSFSLPATPPVVGLASSKQIVLVDISDEIDDSLVDLIVLE